MNRTCLLPLMSLALAIPFAPSPAHAQVTSYIFASVRDGVRLIEATTGTVSDPPVPGTSWEASIAVTPDGRRAIAADPGEIGNIRFLDVARRTYLGSATLNTNDHRFSSVAASPDSQTRAYATSTYGLAVVDIATLAILRLIDVDCDDTLAIAPDGRTLYCTHFDGVRVVDFEQETYVHTISVPSHPRDIAITPDGRFAYVASYADYPGERHVVTPIDLLSHTPLPSIDLADEPRALALSRDGRFLYVTHREADTVSVIEVRTRSIVATIGLGDGPYELAVTPDGAAVSVSNRIARTISIIDVINPASETPTWRVTRPALDIGATALAASEPVIVAAASGAPLEIGGDADLTARGFGTRLVTFDGGTLRLTGPWSTPRQLSVWPRGATIDTNGFDASIAGGVTAPAPIVKRGAGTLTLSGVVPETTGRIQVERGTLTINGRYAGTIAIGNGATPAGDGELGTVLATAGSTISPGLDRFGSLRIRDLLMAPGSTLAITLGPDNFGSDQIDVIGTATIDRATLAVGVGPALPRVGDRTRWPNA